jgi:hypothetical protein
MLVDVIDESVRRSRRKEGRNLVEKNPVEEEGGWSSMW